jgi:hypothetical protein
MKPAETAVVRERLLKHARCRHLKAETDTHATIEEMLEAVFSVRFLPSLYNEDQLFLPVSPSRVQVETLEKNQERVCSRQSVENCSCEKLEAGS